MHRVLFCLVYKHTNNEVFDEFPEDFQSFPKTSEDDPKMLEHSVKHNWPQWYHSKVIIILFVVNTFSIIYFDLYYLEVISLGIVFPLLVFCFSLISFLIYRVEHEKKNSCIVQRYLRLSEDFRPFLEDLRKISECCWTPYLTSEISELLRYRVEHEKKNSCIVYYFVRFINIPITKFLTIFRRFPTLFRFSEDFQSVVQRSYKTFRTFSEIFRRFPKISDVSRRLPRTIWRCLDQT